MSTDLFSSQLSQWLSRYHAFVGAGRIIADPNSGRALGPASGALWEIFPFLAPCAFTGLFAGLSVSGFDPSIETVRIMEYRSRRGFHPVANGPFSGSAWQGMTGEDWSKLVPTDYAPLENFLDPVHQADLRFALDAAEWSTTDPAWTYRQRELSARYLLHHWSHPDGLVVTAVCFTSYAETNRPFLRPCYAADLGAAVDPACLFPHRRRTQLFGGLTVLTAGEEIFLDVSDQTDAIDDRDSFRSETENALSQNTSTVVTVTKRPRTRSALIRTLGGVSPDPGGNISLASTGSHKITRQYAELDTETGYVTLIPHTLYLLSRDEPCCSCDDYVADYERVRELRNEQEKLIETYNETHAKVREIRDQLKETIEARAKLVRLRIEKTELRDRDLRCEFILIYTNVHAEQYEHRGAVIRLSSKSGLLTIQAAKVIEQPRDAEFEIVRFTGSSIEVSPVRSPALSHLAVRLRITLTGPFPEDFNFTIMPQPKEGV